MKALPLTTGLVLFAATLPLPQPVLAGTGIVRCESADGTTIYADRACESFGARAVPIPGTLLTRIASDRDAETFADAAPDAAGRMPDGPGRRSAAAGCARTPTQLAMDLRGSLALGDVNRLAESYHWVGRTHAQARPVLARLDHLNRRPLQDIEFFDVQIGAAAFADAAASTGQRRDGMAGLMQLSFGHGAAYEVVDFVVQRYAGCYFVRFRESGYRA